MDKISFHWIPITSRSAKIFFNSKFICQHLLEYAYLCGMKSTMNDLASRSLFFLHTHICSSKNVNAWIVLNEWKLFLWFNIHRKAYMYHWQSLFIANCGCWGANLVQVHILSFRLIAFELGMSKLWRCEHYILIQMSNAHSKLLTVKYGVLKINLQINLHVQGRRYNNAY